MMIRDMGVLVRDKPFRLAEKMICYDSHVREQKICYDVVIASYLQLLNPTWKNTPFEFFQAKHTLVIASFQLTKFTSVKNEVDRCILRFLDFDHLVLQETGVTDFGEFSGLHLKTIDLSTLEHIPLESINRLKVHDIIMRKGLYSQEEISHYLPEGAQIIHTTNE